MSEIKGFSFNRVLSAQVILAMLFSIYGATVSAAPKKKSSIIQGTPSTSVIVGQGYSFTPIVKGAKKAKFNFKIINKPAWISFNTKTGGMSGRPSSANIGTANGIVIIAKDRKR
jgi:hypothetical protein